MPDHTITLRQERHIRAKLLEVNEIRSISSELELSAFADGHLAGVQQALAWVCKEGADPVSTSMTNKQAMQAAALVAALEGDPDD